MGLEWAGLGSVAAQIELDPDCHQVLERNWPHARRFHDIRAVSPTDIASALAAARALRVAETHRAVAAAPTVRAKIHAAQRTTERPPCSAVVSPVRTFPVVGKVLASMARALGYGQSTEGLSVYACPHGSFSKTPRSLSSEGSGSCSLTLPRSGMTRGGIVYRLAPSALLTSEIGSSSSPGGAARTPRNWPTPLALYWAPKSTESILARLAPGGRHPPTIGEAVSATSGGGTVSLDWLDSVMGFRPGYTQIRMLGKSRAPRRARQASAIVTG